MNNYLYLILDIGTISIPLLYSIFEKKFHFIQYLKKILISILSVAVPFLIWDFFFTLNGIWGFNEVYHLPFTILKMPIEEWLFFICIPFSCLFTHEVLKFYLPNFKFIKNATYLLSFFLIITASVILINNFGKWYTTINLISFIILMSFALLKSFELLQEYLPSFLILLIPFFLVNGILTGSFIEDQVVWYNDNENSGLRIGTIPCEDIFYAFNMLFSVQLIFNCLKKEGYEK